jgi:hypothetical protein
VETLSESILHRSGGGSSGSAASRGGELRFDRSSTRKTAMKKLLPALFFGSVASAYQATPPPAPPHLVGTPGVLGDLDNPPNGLDLEDCTLSDEGERARNTYGFGVLDASVGFDLVFQQLVTAHPELAHFVPLAVVEGSMMLFDPPLNVPLRAGEERRIIRGSGGLRLYLTHSGAPEIETSQFNVIGGTLQETKTFNPHAGLLQTAESLATDQNGKYASLLDILPLLDISVRQVHVFRGPDGYPWIACGCSVQNLIGVFAAADQQDANAAQLNRLLRWNPATLRWDDVSATNLVGQTSQQTWGVASGDLNLDGNPDLVFGNYSWDFHGAYNEIYLGNAAGVFTRLDDSVSPFPSVGFDPTTDVIVADLDHDGFRDIVVANAWVHRQSPAGVSRNYVLFGRNPSGTTPQGLPIPQFDAAFYLDGTSEPLGPRDTVAIDVADVDGDTILDIVAGNHGTIGMPFVHDGYTALECGLPPMNGDVVYDLNVVAGVRSVTAHELMGTGGENNATTDVRFVDVVAPTRVAQPVGNGQKWIFGQEMVRMVPGAQGDGPWEGLDHRDGFSDIARVARGRGGSLLEYFLNDPNHKSELVTDLLGNTAQATVTSFDSYYAQVGSAWVLRNRYQTTGSPPEGTLLPSMLPLYSWHFLRLSGAPDDPTTGAPLGCWALTRVPPCTPKRPSPIDLTLDLFDGLNSLGISAYANALAFADFVPDRAWSTSPPTYVNGVDWPSLTGQPDLLLGLGYELSGLANRLIPFCSSSVVVQRIEGGEMPGLLDTAPRGNFSWTAGWTEKTNKGYGSDLIDADNDGDLDAVTSNRVDGALFYNQGSPATPNGHEGVFKRVKDERLWPETGLPYAHSLCFREDSASADFDEDGDLDVFMTGFVGQHYYGPGYARGQRDEDSTGQSWFSSMPNAARYMNESNYLENQTVGQGPIGGFVQRSELLDINGRVVQGIGGDRILPGDFDADGRTDALEPLWGCSTDNTPGYTMDPGDPTLGLWGTTPGTQPDFDVITNAKALAFRLWMNHPALPAAPLEFVDEAEKRIRCRTMTGTSHFGPLDSQGGENYQPGTTSALLHQRNWLSPAVADLNNDGFLDLVAVYSPLGPGTKAGYDMFLNDGTGKLWDLPKQGAVGVTIKTIPNYEDQDFAGPGGATTVNSFSSAAVDYDQDGDVDVFVSFFNLFQKTALLENVFSSSTPPVNPYDPSLPGAHFSARPFHSTGPITGWLQNYQPTFNAELDLSGLGYADFVTWIGAIDIDLDGDADLAQLDGGPGHRFFLNHSGDALTPQPVLEDFSGDSGAGFTCSGGAPNLADVFWGTRITSHDGALPVDFDAGDLNGDGLPDLFVNYDSRPANVYINDGKRGENVAVATDPAAALVSRVWPPAGAKRGETIRIYGVQMSNIRYVQFLLGPKASGPQAPIVILNTTPGAITTYPHQRFIDVRIPPTASGSGPAAIVVGRRKNPTTVVPSPTYRCQAFAVLP